MDLPLRKSMDTQSFRWKYACGDMLVVSLVLCPYKKKQEYAITCNSHRNSKRICLMDGLFGWPVDSSWNPSGVSNIHWKSNTSLQTSWTSAISLQSHSGIKYFLEQILGIHHHIGENPGYADAGSSRARKRVKQTRSTFIQEVPGQGRKQSKMSKCNQIQPRSDQIHTIISDQIHHPPGSAPRRRREGKFGGEVVVFDKVGIAFMVFAKFVRFLVLANAFSYYGGHNNNI